MKKDEVTDNEIKDNEAYELQEQEAVQDILEDAEPDDDVQDEEQGEELNAEQEELRKRSFMKTLLDSGDEDDEEEISLAAMGKKVFDKHWLMKQMWFIILLGLYLLGLVHMHYLTEDDLLQKEDLQNRIEDMRYRSITINSELTEKMRQSLIEKRLEALGDSTLQPSVDAPYIIDLSEEDGTE